MAKVWIPAPMQEYTAGREVVTVQARNLRELIARLDEEYPGMRGALMKGDRFKPDVAVAIDGNICQLGLLQPVADDNEIFFIPAISGG